MKLTTFILITVILQVSANTFAQKITLSEKNSSLVKVFDKISDQSGYDFLVSSEMLRNAKPVNIEVSSLELKEVLKMIFEEQPLDYNVQEKMVVVSRKSPTFLERLADRWASIDVVGKVVDEKGQPLPGATVKVKDGKGGTMTDGQGRFLIENVKEQAIIVFSYTGYVNKEVTAKADMGVIAMALSENPLDQVQIIAYGTTSKRMSTGNIATVTSKEIEQQPVNNPLLALQGRVPGLVVTQSTGASGSSVNIRIQGRNNLNQAITGSDPLIVVDGVPYPSQNLPTFISGLGGSTILGTITGAFGGPGGMAGSTLAFINPDDITSIDVLKDADATAIYGSRGANGVILITTKKGKVGATKVNVDFQTGWGNVGNKMELMNSEQYLEMRHEAKKNDNAAILATDYDLNGLWDTTRYTDWQKEMIGNTANYYRATATVSGGSSLIKYLVGSTYSRETTVFPGDFADNKGSLNFNISGASSDSRFQFQLSGNFMKDNNRLPGIDYTRFIGLEPVAPKIFNADGTLNWAPDQSGISTWINPLSYNYNEFEIKSLNLIGNTIISYRILPNLEIKTSFGYNQLQSDQFLTAYDGAVRPERRATTTRSANFTNNSIKSWIAEPQLNYNTNLGKDGKLDILAGATFQDKSSDGYSTLARGQSSELLLKNLGAASTYSMSTFNTAYRYSALFSRIGFIFHNRYLINLSGRRDGSSRFGENNLFKNFGAVGAGWIFSEEKFISNHLRFISYAKIRGSYGITGNDQISDYQFMSLFSSIPSSIQYQGIGGLQSTSISNPYLQWEETKKLQVGIDLGFIQDRFLLSATYLRNRTSNTLTQSKLPLMAGAGSLIENFPALIQNTGWEFSLKTDNIKKANFSWSTNFNLTIPRNKLLSFPSIESSLAAGDLRVGKPLNIIKDYAFYGIDPQTGSILFKTVNGNITPDLDFVSDRTSIIDMSEKFYGGLQNSILYRKFQIDFLFQFTKQFGLNYDDFINPGRFGPTSFLANQPTTVLNRWQKPGDITTTAPYTTMANYLFYGDKYYKDASYVRLKNLSISYQLPRAFSERLKIKEGRMFINSQNLFTLTRYKGLDPETQSISTLPPLRMIALGIKLTL